MIYTMEHWKQDRTFSAEPGQEITETVYYEMRGVMPPRALPPATAEEAKQKYNIPLHAGFLMGEPLEHDKAGAIYHAFGSYENGQDAHFFYLGKSHAMEGRTGQYYYIDSTNDYARGLYPVYQFDDVDEAIATAANYESYLFVQEYRNGERISSKLLYTPGGDN